MFPIGYQSLDYGVFLRQKRGISTLYKTTLTNFNFSRFEDFIHLKHPPKRPESVCLSSKFIILQIWYINATTKILKSSLRHLNHT